MMTHSSLPEVITEADAPTFWYAAIEAHDVARVKELLARKAPLVSTQNTHPIGLALRTLRDTVDASPNTVSHEQKRAQLIVDLFLAHPSVDLDQPVLYGATPLILTARFNQVGMTARLLAKGVDVHGINTHDPQYAKSALMEAAAHRHDEILGLLLAHGADPNDIRGHCSPLAICFEETWRGSIEDSVASTVQMLLSAGANPNQCDHDVSPDMVNLTRPPLWYAVRTRDAHAVQTLMEAGAHMAWQRPDGRWESIEEELDHDEGTPESDDTDKIRALLSSWRSCQQLTETMAGLEESPGRRPRL